MLVIVNVSSSSLSLSPEFQLECDYFEYFFYGFDWETKKN